MKKRILVLILVLAVLAAAIVLSVKLRDGSDGEGIPVSGNIEATDIQLGFKIAGRLAGRAVNEGDRVEKGQLLCELESSDEVLAVERARSELDYAASVVEELERGSRTQEIQLARAELDRAQAGLEAQEAGLELARADYERFSRLYEQGGVSLRELEEYRARYDIAKGSHREAVSRVRAAREQLSLVEEGPREERMQQALSRLRNARAALEQAELRLSYTKLHSPVDGVVLSTAAETGEYLNPGTPVLTVAELDRPWLRAYINEPDLGRVRLNQEAEVSTDTYPGKVYRGRVSFIASEAEFTPKSVQTRQERVKLVYRIKIALENPDHELKPGMPADAVILPGRD